jgi:adenosylcobinamide-GDP ribazoletransferase
MRDSRIGTYGTVAVFAVLALRAALLAPLDLTAFSRAVLAGHVLGRAAMLALVRVVPVLPGSSSGLVAGPLTSAGAAVALLTVAVAAVVGAGVWAPGVVALCLLALAACARLFRLRLGGCNGDTLGAANQVIDLVAVASIAALVRADLL